MEHSTNSRFFLFSTFNGLIRWGLWKKSTGHFPWCRMSICWENLILQTVSHSKGDVFFLLLGSEVQGPILIFDVPPEHGSGERFALAGVPLLTGVWLQMPQVECSSRKRLLVRNLIPSFTKATMVCLFSGKKKGGGLPNAFWADSFPRISTHGK